MENVLLDTNYHKPEVADVQKPSPEVFYKKGVLRNFLKFTGKHLCESLFFNKVAGKIAVVSLINQRYVVFV